MAPFQTIQDVLVSRLRADILRGKLRPGQRIIERVVAGEWEISKTPVREALTHLEAEGWVTILPHKGAIVTPLSIAELEEIYMVRVELEGLAARLAAERIDDNTLGALEKLVSRMEGFSSFEESMALNREFHDLLYGCSGRALLGEMIGTLQDKSLRYRWAFLDLSNGRSRLLEQRHLLLRALQRRDTETVERLVRENLIHNSRLLAARMETAQDPLGSPAPFPTAAAAQHGGTAHATKSIDR